MAAPASIPAETSLIPHNLALHFGPGAPIPSRTEDFPKKATRRAYQKVEFRCTFKKGNDNTYANKSGCLQEARRAQVLPVWK